MNWHGDLLDDCSLSHGDWTAHVECMGEIGSLSDGPLEEWYCAVYHKGEQVYHSGDAGGFITSGEQCRAICEAIIKVGTEGES